jgi:desulfoferrodoxin (superoxide reductase-like protein)
MKRIKSKHTIFHQAMSIKGSLYIFIITIITGAAVQFSCAADEKSGGTIAEKNEVPFYSTASPGIWKSQAVDHEVEVTVTRINDRKTINVQIPFAKKKEKNHYVEVIVILDLKRKELQKKSFEKGGAENGASFDFPAEFNSPVYVVMKCNLHDMWEKLVDLNE